MLALFFKGRSLPKFPIGIAVKGKALFSAGICREEGKYSSLTKKNEKFSYCQVFEEKFHKKVTKNF